jgi:hypothetical protein
MPDEPREATLKKTTNSVVETLFETIPTKKKFVVYKSFPKKRRIKRTLPRTSIKRSGKKQRGCKIIN